MIHPQEINFDKFITRYTLEGSRKQFEEFVFEFVKKKHQFISDIKRIRSHPGDWAIDIICGDMKEYNII